MYECVHVCIVILVLILLTRTNTNISIYTCIKLLRPLDVGLRQTVESYNNCACICLTYQVFAYLYVS